MAKNAGDDTNLLKKELVLFFNSNLFKMKKLKLNLSDLPEAELLTKDQLKNIVGGSLSGGTCRYHYTDSGLDVYSDCMSQSAAISGANSAVQYWPDAHWCCDSCVSLGYPSCTA